MSRLRVARLLVRAAEARVRLATADARAALDRQAQIDTLRERYAVEPGVQSNASLAAAQDYAARLGEASVQLTTMHDRLTDEVHRVTLEQRRAERSADRTEASAAKNAVRKVERRRVRPVGNSRVLP